MYLWLESPRGETSEAFAERLLEHGILVAPGSYLGAAGEGYFRRRARALGRGVRARGRDPRGACCDARARRGDRRGARQRRAARREKVGDDWVVDVEAKEAILEYFRLRKVEPIEVGPFMFQDKIPLKQMRPACGSCRRESPATAPSSPRASC